MMRSMGQLSRPFVSQSIGKIEDYFGQALDEPERRVVSFPLFCSSRKITLRA